jgi:2-polyprenyl-3-methyl-5-hydroxy-6-metoxy-1,4-benzoquinol methylase
MRGGSDFAIARHRLPSGSAVARDPIARMAFFDAWADTFARTYATHPALRERIALFAREARAVVDAFEGTGPLRCLDLGCGPGMIAGELAELGFEVVGVERSATMILAARRLITRRGTARERIRFVRADLTDFLASSRETFSLVVSSSVLEYLEDPIEVVRLVAPRLHPGGTFAFSIPNRDSILRVVEPWIERMRPARPRCRSFWGNTLRTADYAAAAGDLGLQFERVETFGLPRLSIPALEHVLRNRWFQTMSLLILRRAPEGAPAHRISEGSRSLDGAAA